MRNKFLLSLGVIVSLIVLTGCPKPIDIKKYGFLTTETRDSLTIAAFDPVIQKNDILYINISAAGSKSSQELTTLYNQPINLTSASNPALVGYLVSPKGTIIVPNVGEIEVAGKTKQQVTDILYKEIKKYLEINPIITVRIINYRVFINGEVTRSGALDVVNEVITLPQAITLAGGFTVYAVKENVQIIRDMGNGKKKIVYVDLRYDDLLEKDKEYFYLKQNDQIYVPANKEKIISSNQSTARTVSYATAALTVLITIFTLFRN